MSRARTLTSGLLALVALLAALVGVPVALAVLGGNPLPDHLPSLQEAWTAISTPDASGSMFIALMTIVGWLGWASFAVSTLVEGWAALTHVKVPQLRGPLGLTQGSSAVLVGAIVAAVTMLSVSTSTPAAAAAPQANASGTTATAQATQASHVAAHTAQTAATSEKAPTSPTRSSNVTVAQGDTLWEIAEDELGDGSRYDELVDASQERVQPDGQRLSDPDLIHPGWTITVPNSTSADDHAPTDQSRAKATPSTQSAPGDRQAKTDAPESPSSEASTPATTSPQTAGAAGRSETASPPSDPPTTTATPQSTPTTTPAPTQTSTPTSSAATPSVEQPEDRRSVVVTAAGLGSLAAAGLLTLLARRRQRQSQHRQPGRRVKLPAGEAAVAEAQLRAAADPVAAADLDRVLRSLAAHLTALEQPMPALRAARLCEDSLELYLVDADQDLPEPFTQDGPGVWMLQRQEMTDEVLLSVEDAAEQIAPYPSLVTIGYDADRAHLLLNLEELRSLSLVGEEELSTAVLTAMTVELLGCEWSDDTRITLVGVLPDLIDAIGSDRATYVDTLDEILTALEYSAGVVRGALTEAGVTDAQQARTDGVVDESWTPHLILLTGPIDPDQQQRLDAVLQATPRVAVASVTAGQTPTGEWTLTLEGDEAHGAHATLAPIGLQVTPQMLPRATYEATLDAFRAADDLDGIDGPEWADGITLEAIDLETIPTASPAMTDIDDDPYGLDALEEVEPADMTQVEEAGSVESTRPEGEHLEEDREDEPVDEPTSSEDHALEVSEGEDLDEEPVIASEAQPLDGDLEEPASGGGDVVDVETPVGELPTDRPQVRLLGPVHVAGATGKKPTAPRRMTEVVAYLALHGGAGPQTFTEAIFPLDRSKKAGQKRNQYMASARNWLGHGDQGQPYVAIVDQDGYHLDESTAVDWWLFQELVQDGLDQTPTSHLRAALDLVTGQPLSGTEEDRYAWADTDRQEIVAAVADVAHELARRALDIGDARTATLAAAKGLDVEPVSEALWRDAIAAAWSTGRPGRAQQVIADCRRRLDEYGDLEDETIDLINDVLTRVRAAQTEATPEPVHT